MTKRPSESNDPREEVRRLRARVAELEKAERLHRLTEATLFRAETEKRIILQSVPEVIVYLDHDFHVQWANRAAVESSHPQGHSVVGRHCYRVWNQREQPCEGCPVVRCFQSGQPEVNELTHPDGRTWLLRAFPVRSKDGVITGAVEVAADVTEHRRHERQLADYRDKLESLVEHRTAELAAANDELAAVNRRLTDELVERRHIEQQLREAGQRAEVANRAKTEFLANMSHEIRTPMTAILGYMDLLSESCPQFCQASREIGFVYMDAIRRNANHLLGLINNILDLSRIEADKLAVESIPCSPHKIIAEVVDFLTPMAKENGLNLDVRFEGPLPETIRSDPMRLRQILFNLIGNAVKFAPRGRVEVDVRLDAEQSLLRIAVADTGPGIPNDQLARLFHPFEQGDNSTTRRFGGSGLGLAISRRLAQLLGGDIRAENRKSGGAVFHVHIATGPLEGVPRLEGAASTPPTVTASGPGPSTAPRLVDVPPDGRRILLAEDGIENQRLLCALLKKFGVEVVVAVDGKEAHDAALAESRSGRPFALILMDMQMPVWDGYQATRSLRKLGYTGRIVALTAHAMPGDRERCLEAGCDDYLSKPINRERLRQVVQTAVPEESPRA